MEEDKMYGLTKEERRRVYDRNMRWYEAFFTILQSLTIVFAFFSLKKNLEFFSAVVLLFAVLNGAILLVKYIFIATPGYREFCTYRKEGDSMKKRAFIVLVFVLVIGSVCFAYLHGKNEIPDVSANTKTDEKIFQLNETIAIKGQNKTTGEEVQIEAFVEKAVLRSGSLAVFYQFERPEDILTSGVKEIEVVMKNGETFDLWNECDNISVSYDKETKEAVTYIIFPESRMVQDVEKIKVHDTSVEVL